jgi:hypothetical protein
MAYVNNLVTEVIVGKVKAEVQVERGLASAYRLHPPLRTAPRFRDKAQEVRFEIKR